ncbi:hypothetical protein HY086_02555 [Candidatus Gottesmanbacteria bacterium]|nr:hypothetical protein [Candidatus Gottesmanbacteria bacterium]
MPEHVLETTATSSGFIDQHSDVQNFSSFWLELYGPYVSPWDVDVLSQLRVGQGVPMPTDRLQAARSPEHDSELQEYTAVVDIDSQGRQVIVPVFRNADGTNDPAFRIMTDLQWREEFGFNLSAETKDYIRTVWNVDAMLLGVPGSHRIAQALSLIRATSEVKLLQYKTLSRLAKSMYGDSYPKEIAIGLHNIDLLIRASQSVDGQDTMTAITALREYMQINPGLVYAYAVGQITTYLIGEKSGLNSADIAWFHHVSTMLTEANVGRVNEQEFDTFLLAGVNDAISFLKDRLFTQTHPNVAALTFAHLDHKAPLSYAMRYNSFYMTQFFQTWLGHTRLIRPELFDSQAVRLYGNAKPIRAAAIEAAKNPEIQKSLLETARQMGVAGSEILNDERMNETQRALRILDLLESSIANGIRADHPLEQPSLINFLNEYGQIIFNRYDNLRCRAHFTDPKDLNWTVQVAKMRLNLSHFVRPREAKRVGDQLDLYMSRYVYRGGTQVDSEELRGKDFPSIPSRYISQTIDELTSGQLAYIAVHLHLPIIIGQALRKGGKREKFTTFLEVQLSLQALAPMLNALERVYKRDPPSLDALSNETIERIRKQTQEILKRD